MTDPDTPLSDHASAGVAWARDPKNVSALVRLVSALEMAGVSTVGDLLGMQAIRMYDDGPFLRRIAGTGDQGAAAEFAIGALSVWLARQHTSKGKRRSRVPPSGTG